MKAAQVDALVILVARTAMRMGPIPFVGDQTPRVVLDVARDLTATDGLARVNVDRLVQAVERHVVRGQAQILVESVMTYMTGLTKVDPATRLDSVPRDTEKEAVAAQFARENLGDDAPLVEIGATRTVAEETARVEAALVSRIDEWYGERQTEEDAQLDADQLADADARMAA